MPRVYTSDNDPIDFCENCFPDRGGARMRFAHLGDGPDGRGNCFSYDVEHPPYTDEDRCYDCGRKCE